MSVLALGVVTLAAAACSTSATPRHHSSAATTRPTSSAATTPATPAPTSSSSRAGTPTRRPTSVPAPGSTRPTAQHHASGVQRLPLSKPTGSARQVLTVVAPGAASTTATLQAWHKVSGGWARSGPTVPAWLGRDGLSSSPSESRSATPIGSFTLTQAFGHDPDPGTALPYTHTTPDDWWISQPGPLYNTRQRCHSGCAFTRADPNEHLYYETPYYDHAVVIDYNTANAPGGVHQGAGSAFFLHVTDGSPTAGCVSIDAGQLVRIMRWLNPADHPRIVIGVG